MPAMHSSPVTESLSTLYVHVGGHHAAVPLNGIDCAGFVQNQCAEESRGDQLGEAIAKNWKRFLTTAL